MRMIDDCRYHLVKAGIAMPDADELRRISMTLHRWHELECGDGNNYGSWAIERLPVTCKRLQKLSSPACSPQYMMTIPANTECKQIDGKWVVADISRIKNGNAHDLEHYYVWIDDADVVELPFMVHHHYQHGQGKDYITHTRISDREAGALKRLAKIMERYPQFAAYVQGDPRGAALYILDKANTPQPYDQFYSRGIAVHK